MTAERLVDVIHDGGVSETTVTFLEGVLRSVLNLIFVKDVGVEVTLSLPGAERVRELNRDLRGADRRTDVLSFPEFFAEAPIAGGQPRAELFRPEFIEAAARAGAALPACPTGALTPVIFLGEILLDLEFAENWALENGVERGPHLKLLLVHSLLHLLGLDHADEGPAEAMESLEGSLLNNPALR